MEKKEEMASLSDFEKMSVQEFEAWKKSRMPKEKTTWQDVGAWALGILFMVGFMFVCFWLFHDSDLSPPSMRPPGAPIHYP